jgi:hypothetical protein
MDFAAGVYLFAAQIPIPPPPPITLYTCIQCTYSHRERGRGLNQREGEKGNSSQSWLEYTSMTYCISSL